MKLSFIIPAFNEEKNIGKCLKSIIAQKKISQEEIEIIVVNNASTDATGSIAASFPEVTIVNEPEKGLVKARNAGFLASTGDLIANVDADTILTSNWINLVFKEFKKNPKLVALSGPFIYYDLSWLINFGVRSFYYVGYSTYLVNRFILNVGSMLQGGNFIVKRSALEQIGGFNTSIDFYGEDTDIARRLHAVGPVKFTFSLPLYTTGRRLKAEGVFRMAARYALNYFWITFFKKPYTQKSIDIRVDK